MHVRNVGDILRCTGWPEKPRPAADVARIFNTLRLVCMIFDYFIRNVLLRASGHISQLHLHQLYKIKCFISNWQVAEENGDGPPLRNGVPISGAHPAYACC